MQNRRLIATVVTLLAGCYAEDVSTSVRSSELEGEGLVIEAESDREFVGSYTDKAGTLTFDTRMESETDARAFVVVNDTPIDIFVTVDGDTAFVGYDGHGGTLDEVAHALLASAHREIFQRFPYPEEGASLDDTPGHVQLLRSYLGWFSEAPMRLPDGVEVTRVDREDLEHEPNNPPTGTGGSTFGTVCQVADNDGVVALPQCCGGGTDVAWQHDSGSHCFTTMVDRCGSSSKESGQALATDCPGRCGPECGAFPGYFQDCFDHDLCVQHDGGWSIDFVGGCGDEIQDAADDFAFSFVGWFKGFSLTNFPGLGIGGGCS